jgi:hypothetical protein
MPKIDEVKSEIDWLKDLFKILVIVLVALVAGISKLYLDETVNILFYIGIVLGFGFTIWLAILAKKIKLHIKELGEI